MSRLLIIDDEPSSRLVLQNRLKDRGYAVEVLENGAQGLHEAREKTFDLVLVDDGLSAGVDAYDVCRRLKQSRETASLPVILLSKQSAQKEALHKGYSAGCDDYLCKADMAILEDVIAAILRRKANFDDLIGQLRALEDQFRRLQEGHKNAADLEAGLNSGDLSKILREVAAGAPDGLLVVDAEGVVCMADRGAYEILGNRIEGVHLGQLARGTGLEAFVRDAHTEPRDGFRFDLQGGNARPYRQLMASVVPLVASPGEKDTGLRVLLLLDAGRRRVASEIMRSQESDPPRRDLAVLVELARMHSGPASLVGSSQDTAQLRSLVASAAKSPAAVYIQGEAGVGKKHVARALHFTGGGSGPFLSVHCGALEPANLAAELFGQSRAEGGPLFDRPSIFLRAENGTVLLEHIEHLTPELQAQVLRVVRDREVPRPSSDKIDRIDARILASSGIDLERECDGGRFDRELYDLFSDLAVEILPLRQRPDDISVLAQYFLERYGAGHRKVAISDEAVYLLEIYAWPENVRELATCIERACARAAGDTLSVEDLSQPLRDLHSQIEGKEIVPSRPVRVAIGGTHVSAAGGSAQNNGRPRREFDITDEDPPSFDVYEKKLLLRALDETGGDKLAAARLLEVGKSTLYRKLKRHDIK